MVVVVVAAIGLSAKWVSGRIVSSAGREPVLKTHVTDAGCLVYGTWWHLVAYGGAKHMLHSDRYMSMVTKTQERVCRRCPSTVTRVATRGKGVLLSAHDPKGASWGTMTGRVVAIFTQA